MLAEVGVGGEDQRTGEGNLLTLSQVYGPISDNVFSQVTQKLPH